MDNRARSKRYVAAVSAGLVGFLVFAAAATAEIKFGGEGGWQVGVGGSINAFVPYAKWDQGNSQEATTRVMSGFNPSKLNVGASAPRWGAVDLAGHIQIAPSIQANKAKFAGNSIEARVLEVTISGPFGTVSAGRSWSIFNSQAIIHDTGSGLGVGRIATPDRGGPAFGRIGTGYTYTDFDPRVAYTTPDLGGFQLSVGVFDPIELPFGAASLPQNGGGMGVGALQTAAPRLEGEARYAVTAAAVAITAWAGGLFQPIEDLATGSSTTIAGADAGVHLGAFGLGLTAAYTLSKGVGASGFQGNGFVCDAAGCRAATASFWYLLVDYTFGQTTLGVSTGMGSQKARAGFDQVDNLLHAAFVQREVVPHLHAMFELHHFESRTAGVRSERYNAAILGAQYDF